MKFKFVPKAEYKIGQIIELSGQKMLVARFSQYGGNFVVRTLADDPRLEEVLCIQADEGGYVVGIPA